MVQVMVPGSCGELVQGILDGVNFHIACPISKHSIAAASMIKTAVVNVPDGLAKTEAAVKKVLEKVSICDGIEITVTSELPKGKGMASSTADIAAASVATKILLNQEVDAQEIAKIALSIEPTDGVFFDKIVAFDHMHGLMLEEIGEAPPLEVIVLEPPESINTLDFNSRRDAVGKINKALFREAYDMAVEGIRSGDIRLVGEAATMSSILNQKVLLKPALNDIIEACKTRGAVGVNVAHSGTVIGILVELGFGNRLLERISHYIPRSWDAYVVKVINGGFKVLECGRKSYVVLQ